MGTSLERVVKSYSHSNRENNLVNDIGFPLQESIVFHGSLPWKGVRSTHFTKNAICAKKVKCVDLTPNTHKVVVNIKCFRKLLMGRWYSKYVETCCPCLSLVLQIGCITRKAYRYFR
jgi:hypothetical protein